MPKCADRTMEQRTVAIEQQIAQATVNPQKSMDHEFRRFQMLSMIWAAAMVVSAAMVGAIAKLA